MKTGCLVGVVVAILLVIVIGGLSAFFWYKNGIDTVVRLDETVKEKWGQVETVLQRRYDLIPNLIETVKGYAGHEKELLAEVTELRTRWMEAPTASAKAKFSGLLDSAISRLLVVSERYPDLKANQNFITFQKQLEGTENRINVERERYNTAVKEFNSYIRSFFGTYFAKKRDLTDRAEYYEAAPEAAEAPKVEF